MPVVGVVEVASELAVRTGTGSSTRWSVHHPPEAGPIGSFWTGWARTVGERRAAAARRAGKSVV